MKHVRLKISGGQNRVSNRSKLWPFCRKDIGLILLYVLYVFFIFFIADRIYGKFEKFPFNHSILRLQRWRPDSFKVSDIPGLIYEMVPNLKKKDKFIETNSMGIRGKEYRIPKPSNTFRVLLLGDSVAYGIGLDYSEVFSTILEDKLNNNNKNNLKLEIINASVSGYNTMQEYIAFVNKWHIYEPDLVLVCFCWNDMTPAFVQFEHGKGIIYDYLKHKSPEGLMLKNMTAQEMLSISMPNIFHMPHCVHRRLILYSSIYRAITIKAYDFMSSRNKYRYPPYAYLSIVDNQTEYAVKNFKTYCKEHSMDLIFLLFPLLYDTIPKDIPDHVSSAKMLLEGNSMKYFELRPYYKSHIDSLVKLALNPIPSDYYHLNKLGHKLTADALYDYLVEYLERRYSNSFIGSQN